MILFGVGPGVDFYFSKYGYAAKVDEIIDNDESIWGVDLQDFLIVPIAKECGKLRVSGIDLLEKCDKENTVVLITSLKHYNEIAYQLELIGITKYFSVLCMEALYRETSGIREVEDCRSVYEEKCLKEPINPKRIIFITTHGFSGHGKEIARQLIAMRKDVDIVWPVKDPRGLSFEGIRFISQKNFREYTNALFTSMLWISDTGVPNEKRRKGQIYIQMKHWASITLKMFGYDEMAYRGERNPEQFGIHGLDDIDYCIVGSEFDERTCRSGFHFKGKAVYVGSPRSDILFRDNEAVQNVKNVYPNISGKRTLLFAPTYRVLSKGSVETVYHNDMDFRLVKECMERSFGGEWLILLRLHPFVAEKSKDVPHPDYVVDVSDYPDSEELVAVSDAMVTDYSSIMFEPAFVKKPVFLLATDKDHYLNNERGFLIDYNTLPFPIAESNDPHILLLEAFDPFNQEEYERDVNVFFDRYGVHEDGHAGERAAKFISDLIEEKCMAFDSGCY